MMNEKEIKEVLIKVGENVRKYRKQKSTNYESFAKDYGINKVTLLRIESGENSSLKSLIQIARILEVKIELLFQFDE